MSIFKIPQLKIRAPESGVVPLATKSFLQMPYPMEQIMYGGDAKKNLVRDEAQAYERVSLIFRAVNLRAKSLVKVPRYFYDENENELDQWPFEESLTFDDFLFLAESSLLLKGHAAFVKVQNAQGESLDQLQWLNPFTVNVKKERGQTVYEQWVDGEHFPKTGYWTGDDMLYLREFSPSSDYGPGTASASVALMDSQLRRNLTRFFSAYFEGGAMPVALVVSKTRTSPEQIKKLESFFRSVMTGVRNVMRVTAVEGDIEMKSFTPELKTFDLEKLDTHTINNVVWAFDIPKTVLTSDSANYATASTEKQTFIADTIGPRATWYESRLDAILKEYGCQVEFAIQELPEMQEDEAKRAQAYKLYVDGGMKPQLAAAILGIDIPKDFEDFWKEEPKPAPPPMIIAPVPPQPPDETPVKAEMQRWERKAMKAVKSGRRADVEFITDLIPNEVKAKIAEALSGAKSEDEVRGVFTATGMRVGGPGLTATEVALMMKSAQQTTSINFNGEDIGTKIANALKGLKIDGSVVVNVPEQAAPVVNVSVPETKQPDVIVNVPEMRPQITVNVPEIKIPATVVNVPEQKPPQVTVTESQPQSAKVVRDAQGRIKEIVSE